MKGVINLPDDFFLKYKDKPVKITPFNQEAKRVGLKTVKEIQELLFEFPCEVLLRGSTLYEISGKGDVEIGVYLEKELWKKIFDKLKDKFGDPEVAEEEYVRFNVDIEDFEFEIMMFTGRGAYVDKKLMEYLVSHPATLKEYEEVKKKYSYSRRDYNREKNRFLRKVEEKIPEE